MRALILALSLLPVLPAHADELLTRIATQLGRHAVVRAEFTQGKQINGLKRPLQTSGKLIFTRQYGVLWQIDQPYQISYILSEDKVVEIAADGSRKERLARDLPGLSQVGRVFRAMLGVNTDTLREYFDIGIQGDVANWSLSLAPRQAQMAQFIERLDINGSTFVSTIRIQESSGDLTQIRFRNSSGTSGLSEAEQKLFSGGDKP